MTVMENSAKKMFLQNLSLKFSAKLVLCTLLKSFYVTTITNNLNVL